MNHIYGQSSAVLALHFGFSLLSYASIFILMMHIFKIDDRLQLPTSSTENSLRWGLLALFIGTYGVVYLGAYVRHTGSVLGCKGWPLCSGYVIPPLTGQMGIQFTHRFAAFLLFLAFIWLVIHAYKYYRHDRTIVRQSVWLLVFLFMEIISGGIVVLSNINNYASLVHALIITLMFGLQCYLTLYVFRKDKAKIT